MAGQGLNRRHFFFGSLLAGAIPSGGYGTVKSLKALGYKPYYDKLNVAAIGCGGQGGRILNEVAQTENIVALCDVDEKRAAENFQRYSKQPKYADFRVMLEKQDNNIDACTIGIPDHMHAAAALACMQAGKHVYLEKPLTRTPWEARLMVDAAKKYGVATQMGNQGYSHESIRVTSEILWSGEIGDVREVHASSSPGTHPVGLTAMPDETSVPAGLNWDLWLGSADMRAYNPTFTPYNWRGYFDFGTGQLGNWGIHVLGPVNMALQLGAPTSVELLRQVDSSQWTFPTRAVLKYDFPARGKMPPVSLYWHDSPRPTEEEAYRVPGMDEQTILPTANNLSAKGRGPEPRPSRRRRPRSGPPMGAGGPGVEVFGYERRGDPAQPGVLSSNGAVFVGSKGMMATVARGEGVHLLPAERWQDYELPPQLLTRSPGHMNDWVRACKGGDAACSDFRVSGPYSEWVVLGAIAFRVPGKLEWDSAKLQFTNSDEANKFVKPTFRKGWELHL